MKPPVICVGIAVDVEHFPGGRKPFPLTAVRKIARACSMLRSAPTYSAQYRDLICRASKNIPASGNIF